MRLGLLCKFLQENKSFYRTSFFYTYLGRAAQFTKSLLHVKHYLHLAVYWGQYSAQLSCLTAQ